MALSAFDDRARPPDLVEFVRTLGKAADRWASLMKHVALMHGPVTQQWRFAGEKLGWSARLERRGRIVVYLTPQRGAFTVGIVLGEKAAVAAEISHLPKVALRALRAAPRYAEGRGIRLPVRSATALRAAIALIDLKLAKRLR